MQAARGASLSDADTPESLSDRPGRRRLGVLAAVAAVVLVLDQLTKWWAVRELAGDDPVQLLGGLLTLRIVRNSGAAFGMAAGATVLFTGVAAVVVVVVLRMARRLASLPWALSLGMLLGGALGNLTDRLARAPGPLRGHVVDFLELPHWPVFNLADSAIVIAGLTMVVYSLRGLQIDGTVHRG